ncbi:putative claudin-24 [Anguilla rostrata]|uniref:Claudin n=1 Tax=Anguilla anguilla TaxID=7936 RepID=A0A9D3M480_ANGAN|nr:putative claudin-24 [Anguilla anguilla]KAG5840393.1 hypothetical protein ANANG_G00188320 [Anguilla anguilla]
MVLLTVTWVQRVALFLSFAGLVITFVTTLVPLWKCLNTDLNEMENWYEGLWHTCIFQDEQGLQCKALDSFLALPTDLLVSRVLMLVSVGTGLLSVTIAFFGLEGVDLWPGRHALKRGLLIVGGLLSLVSGVTTLLPISMVAYVTVVEFWDETVPEIVPRWEFGEALFSGWFSGLFLFVGGTFLLVSVCMTDRSHRHTSLPSSLESGRKPQYLKTVIL